MNYKNTEKESRTERWNLLSPSPWNFVIHITKQWTILCTMKKVKMMNKGAENIPDDGRMLHAHGLRELILENGHPIKSNWQVQQNPMKIPTKFFTEIETNLKFHMETQKSQELALLEVSSLPTSSYVFQIVSMITKRPDIMLDICL